MIFMDATILLYYKTGTNGHIANMRSTRIYKGDSAKYPNARMPDKKKLNFKIYYILYI